MNLYSKPSRHYERVTMTRLTGVPVTLPMWEALILASLTRNAAGINPVITGSDGLSVDYSFDRRGNARLGE